ncbi:MAG TPA: hypothetical protein VKD67_14230 [Acidimicrobiales bacterium]|nr:hypothetical protein [Acidimicrobiales bacterium]
MRSTERWATLLVALTLLAAAAGTLFPGSTPPAGAMTPARPITNVSAMGDSTLLGLTYNPSAGRDTDARSVVSAQYGLLYAAASCRSLIGPSCGRNPPTTVLEEMQSHQGQLGQVLVIMGGYDDPDIRPGLDAIVAEATRQGVGTVLWLTYRTNVSYNFGYNYVRFNGYLQEKAQEYKGTLVIADWNSYSANHPEWMVDDGVHVNATGAFALANFIVASIKSLTPARCAGDAEGDPSPPPTATNTVTAPPGKLTPSAPKRILDTRPDDGDSYKIPLGDGNAMTVPIQAKGATAAVVNLTAVDPCAAGFLTAYPCGTTPPLASSVNFPARRTTATQATVMLDGNGNFCLYAFATTDVIVDLFGLYGSNGSGYTPLTPTRFVDTRPGASGSALTTRLSPNAPATVKVAGVAGVPANAAAVSFNLTAVAPDNDVFVAAYPCSGSPALVSNVNALAGTTVANNVVVALDSSGSICLLANTGVDVLVDVTGSFGSGGSRYYASTPTRLLDTRTSGGVGRGGQVAVTVPGGGIAAALSVTVTGPGGPGYVTVTPCGTSPLASALNYVAGDLVTNLAAAGLDGSGRVCISTYETANIVVDLAGVWK